MEEVLTGDGDEVVEEEEDNREEERDPECEITAGVSACSS